MQSNSYLASLLNYSNSDQLAVGDNNYVDKAYSESGLLVTSLCDVVLKILMLALIGFAYDCVSYAILKKVQFMQVLLISLSFVVFSVPVFIGLDS